MAVFTPTIRLAKMALGLLEISSLKPMWVPKGASSTPCTVTAGAMSLVHKAKSRSLPPLLQELSTCNGALSTSCLSLAHHEPMTSAGVALKSPMTTVGRPRLHINSLI